MSKLHYFNPGHEIAVLSGNPNFYHKQNVQIMQKDLHLLPIWYAEDSDIVLSDLCHARDFLQTIPEEWRPRCTIASIEQLNEMSPSLPPMLANPWGLSYQSVDFFTKLCQQCPSLKLEIQVCGNDVKKLTGRKIAALCLDYMKEHDENLQDIHTPFFCHSINEVEEYLASVQNIPLIFKMPYSSSGRGLLWIKQLPLTHAETAWVNRAIMQQGYVGIEPALNKVADYALEYYSNGKGRIDYVGLSVFDTNNRGSYLGNQLKCPKLAEEDMQQLYPECYQRIKDAITQSLRVHYASHYTGYLGVDIMAYKREDGTMGLHPCIEINVRHTMGLLAFRLSERIFQDTALKGVFMIEFARSAMEIAKKHAELQKKHPLCRDCKGKLVGYMPLCPINAESLFLTYIIVLSE